MPLVGWAEAPKERKSTAKTLYALFSTLYDYLYNHHALKRSDRLGSELNRLLLCKIFDEMYQSDHPQFVCYPDDTPATVHPRIVDLLARTKARFAAIFEPSDELQLKPPDLMYVVQQLAPYHLLTADRDAMAEGFQAIVTRALRREQGQYFTPRNVIQFCIHMLSPKPTEVVADLSCGSGGFLAETFLHLQQTYPTTDRKLLLTSIIGADKELELSRTTSAYLAVLGGDYPTVFCGDSLSPSPELMARLPNGSADIIATNPPFGVNLAITDPDVLARYDLGHRWTRSGDRWKKEGATAESQAPQCLFMERYLRLLKPHGRMAIVLPDGIFGNPSQSYIVQYILTHAKLLGIVGLPPEVFSPSAHVKTSILFLEKDDHPPADYKIFMAIVSTVGHDANGRPKYRLTSSGGIATSADGHPLMDDDLPIVQTKFDAFLHTVPLKADHYGFTTALSRIKRLILIPSYYNAEVTRDLHALYTTKQYSLTTIGQLREKGWIDASHGLAIESAYYGTGNIPFVRTSDIGNWEVLIDPKKNIGISPEIYAKYANRCRLHHNDVIMVTDGTFLIGRTAILYEEHPKYLLQGHITRFHCPHPTEFHPYLLLYLLNTRIVQRQIEAKTFVQTTISNIGERLDEIVVPIPVSTVERDAMISQMKAVLDMKMACKQQMDDIQNHL